MKIGKRYTCSEEIVEILCEKCNEYLYGTGSELLPKYEEEYKGALCGACAKNLTEEEKKKYDIWNIKGPILCDMCKKENEDASVNVCFLEEDEEDEEDFKSDLFFCSKECWNSFIKNEASKIET